MRSRIRDEQRKQQLAANCEKQGGRLEFRVENEAANALVFEENVLHRSQQDHATEESRVAFDAVRMQQLPFGS